MADDAPGEPILVREAGEGDVDGIRRIFRAIYSKDYPYHGFFDAEWLKRSIFSDDILTLVAEDPAQQGRILGTASVLFDLGAHSDLIGEFGRLAVHPEARGRGIGSALMKRRIEFVAGRLHMGLAENRTVHEFSQRVSARHGFCPVGFLPQKSLFKRRESLALWVRHFGDALALRKNHPRVVPEAHALAHLALSSCGLPADAIADEEAAPYPRHVGFDLEELTAQGLPALLRIERGRISRREVFGPMRLHYGFFKLAAKRASYLIAREPVGGDRAGPVAGAVGFIRDEQEKSVRVFELIARTDEAPRFVLERLLEHCGTWGTEYVEIDVGADAPRMQRTLIELGFLPAAYVPAMVFHEVERLDVIKMVRLLVPIDVRNVHLSARTRTIADEVLRAFRRQAVLPEIGNAIGSLTLFAGLTDEQAARVASACGAHEIGDGERLFAAAAEANRMHILIEGTARVEDGETGRKLGTVGAGESVGEVAILTDEPHSATVVAEGPVRAAFISKEALRALVRQRPDIGVVLYRNLAVGLGRKLQRLDSDLAAAD